MANFIEKLFRVDARVLKKYSREADRVLEYEKEMRALSDEDLNNLSKDLSIEYICEKCHLIMLWYSYAFTPIKITQEQVNTLNDLIYGEHCIVITNLTGYLRFLPSKKTYEDFVLNLWVGEEISPKFFVEKLII